MVYLRKIWRYQRSNQKS